MSRYAEYLRQVLNIESPEIEIDYEHRDTFLGHLDLHTRRYRNGVVTLNVTARPDPRNTPTTKQTPPARTTTKHRKHKKKRPRHAASKSEGGGR